MTHGRPRIISKIILKSTVRPRDTSTTNETDYTGMVCKVQVLDKHNLNENCKNSVAVDLQRCCN